MAQNGNGDAMQVDSSGLPEEIAAKVDATQEKLSKSRRKRPVPEGWVTTEKIEGFDVTSKSKLLYPGSSFVAVDSTGTRAIVGGKDGVAGVYSVPDDEIHMVLNVGAGAITDAVWYGDSPVVATASGTIKVFEGSDEAATFRSHAGSANALALHPSGEILASVGADKSFVFYDLVGRKAVSQIYTDSGMSPKPVFMKEVLMMNADLTTAAFHPDGHLIAVGTTDGKVKMYLVKTGDFAAEFDCAGPVQSLSFSENGTWFSVAVKGSTTVTTFDLRKQGAAAEVNSLDIGSRVESIAWDYTGQYLATAGPSGITVQQYTKSSKSWSEPKRSAVPATAVAWGANGASLVTVNHDGVITILASA